MPKKIACLSPEADRCLYIKRFPGVGPTINMHFCAATASCRNFSFCLRWSLAPGFLLHSFSSQSVVFRGDVVTLLSFQIIISSQIMRGERTGGVSCLLLGQHVLILQNSRYSC